MLKRTLPICFLFLAGIILAGHAIIPHHHHTAVSEIVDASIIHHHENDSKSPADHSHEHKGCKSKCFVLDQIVICRSGATRSFLMPAPASNLDIDLGQPLVACLPHFHSIIISESSLFRRTDHPKPSIFFLSRDQQFRGPPAA